jgi:hypothetical protein
LGVEPLFDVCTDNTGVVATSDHPEEVTSSLAFPATEGLIAFETEGPIPIESDVAEQVD